MGADRYSSNDNVDKPPPQDGARSLPGDALELRCNLKMEDTNTNSNDQDMFRGSRSGLQGTRAVSAENRRETLKQLKQTLSTASLVVLGRCFIYACLIALVTLFPLIWGTARTGACLSNWSRADCIITGNSSQAYEATFVNADNVTVTTKIDVFLDSNIPVDEPITCVYDPSDEQDVMPLSCLERDYQSFRFGMFWIPAVAAALPLVVCLVVLIPHSIFRHYCCLNKNSYIVSTEEAVRDFAAQHHTLDANLQIGPGMEDVEDQWIDLPQEVTASLVSLISYLEDKTLPTDANASEPTIVRGVYVDSEDDFLKLTEQPKQRLTGLILVCSFVPIMLAVVMWPCLIFVAKIGSPEFHAFSSFLRKALKSLCLQNNFNVALLITGVMNFPFGWLGVFTLPLRKLKKRLKYIIVTNKWVLLLPENTVEGSPYPFTMIVASIDASQHAVPSSFTHTQEVTPKWRVSYGEYMRIIVPSEDRARRLSDFMNDCLTSV